MAYPNFGYPQYQQPVYPIPQQLNQPQLQQLPIQQVPQQMQSGGFMSVRNEQEARNYPVAPGNVMTFKIENQPYVCEKSQGFSQLEGPVFNKYRLVKEEDIIEQEPLKSPEEDSTQKDIGYLKEEVSLLKEEIRILKEKIYAKPKSLNRDNQDNKGGHKDE